MKVFSSRFKNLHSGKILFAVFSIIISYFSAVDGGDFDVYIEASHKLFHGQNPYLPPYAKDGMGYSYSPFFIILLIPFTFSYFWTEFLWCLLMCLLLYRSYMLFIHYLNPELSASQKKVWTWLILIFSIQFIINNLPPLSEKYLTNFYHLVAGV